MRSFPAVLVLLLLFHSSTWGQPLHFNISNFTVKAQLPPDINDWINIPGSLLLTVQKNSQAPGYNPGLVIQVKNGSGIVCGNNAANPISLDQFTVRNFTTAQLVGYLGQCPTLQPGTYSICVQFYNEDKKEVSREVCKEFIVTGQQTECAAPVNIGPSNDKVLQDKDVIAPLIFTWSPVVPFNSSLVTYKLTVWEIEEGQMPSEAMYNNLPVLEQEVHGQTRYAVRPNYFEKRNSKYVWRVVALNNEGRPICTNAQSEYTLFSIALRDRSADLNSPCGNGDFESGILDPAEWSGGYTKVVFNDNSNYTTPFNSIIQPTNANPIDANLNAGCGNAANENHHVIVTVGPDPTVPALSRVPPSIISNNYALRLGNNCNGFGAERITKHFTVTAADSIYKFMYALVFQAPHDSASNPSLWVRVFNAAGTAVTGLVYLDPSTNSPMDRAISNPANPYWQAANGVLYRDWACAKINLSSLIGQTITLEIIINDCAQGAHYGYGYFDNFCAGCNNNPPSTDCCADIIKAISNNVSVNPTDLMSIAQEFSITPVNIKYVTAEIISINENTIDTSCMECNGKEAWAYKFIANNTASWNNAMAMNATPVNSTAYYPANLIEWHCNQQGNLKFNLKISLPGTKNGCTRKGKVCIRYRFTDINCKTCERIICYNFTAT